MRVLHVSAYFAPAWDYGGPPRSLLGLCQALRQAQVDARVFTTTANGRGPELPVSRDWEEEGGVPVRRFARGRPRRFFGSRGLRAALRRECAAFDVIHVNGLWNATVSQAMRIAADHGRPFVVSPRGMLERGALRKSALRKRLAWQLRERGSLQRATLLHASSQVEAHTLRDLLPGVRVVTIPHGVDPASVRAAPGQFRERHGLGTAPLVVFLGRQHRIKRLDLLAAAFAQVLDAHPDARLVIAGPREETPSAATQTALFEVADQTLRTGRLDAAARAKLLADATVLVSCSDSESFGMGVVEALAAGVPVVATRTTPWEVLEQTGCGRWVPQHVDAIAGAIHDLLADARARDAMGARAQALVAERFSWEAVGAAMLHAYASVGTKETSA